MEQSVTEVATGITKRQRELRLFKDLSVTKVNGHPRSEWNCLVYGQDCDKRVC